MARGFRRNEAADAAVVRAASAHLTEEDMLAFARNRSEAVREAIAGRPDATPAALLALAADSAVHVRAAVARNEAAAESAPLLELLARDKDPYVLAALIRNPAVPSLAKEALRPRQEADVRRAFEAIEGASDGGPAKLAGSRNHGILAGADPLEGETDDAPRQRTAPVRGFRGSDT